jgi:hypothetical protein
MATVTPKDVLVINEAHQRAFFGWYEASQMSPTAWDLLNRTIRWAAGDVLPNETRIVFFSNLLPFDDAAIVYGWLVSSGYDEFLIDHLNQSESEQYSASFYDDYDLVVYWHRTPSNATNIILSKTPFISVSAGQTDEMGLGTGVATLQASNDTFHIVNVNYYPTYTYPWGPVVFPNPVGFDAVETAGAGRVLITAEIEGVASTVGMSNVQTATVFPEGNATVTFSLHIPAGPLADLYREHFFDNTSALEPEVEYELPDSRTVEVLTEVEEGVVDVSLPGDVTGDGVTDIFDIVTAALAYGAVIGDAEFDCVADINWDGIIDIFDVVVMAVHFGKTQTSTGTLCVVGYYNGTEVGTTDVFYVGPHGESSPTNVSACGYSWFGLYPGLYTIYGSLNGSQTSTVATVAAQETSWAQLDHGGTERPPMPLPYIPIRADYHQAIEDEQKALLGFDVEVTESKITPRATGDAVSLSLTAYAPTLAQYISFWRIPVGPHDLLTFNNSASLLFWKAQLLQTMLRRLPGDQVFESSWDIQFTLPSGASILNAGDLLDLNWTIAFGGGSYLAANLTLDTTSVDPKVYVSETIVVTEQTITISEGDFTDAVAVYRIFDIDYILGSMGNQTAAPTTVDPAGINLRYYKFEKTLRFTIPIPEYRRTWEAGPITATVHVRPQLSIAWKVSGRWDWLLRSFQRFGTWINVSAQVDARAWGMATEAGSKQFGPHTFGSITLTRWAFAIGPIPVWANLRLSAHGRIRVQAAGNVTFELRGLTWGWFKAGVHYHRGEGFDPHWSTGFDGGAVLLRHVEAELTITPAAALRLALLIYDIAGPFIEGEVYTPLVLSFPPAEIESFKLKFRVNYGLTFADWLKSLCGLKDWTREIAHWTVWTII